MTQSLRALLALSLVLAVAGCDSGFRPLGFMDRFRGNDASDVPPPAVAEEVAEEEAVEAATGEEAEAPAPSAASGSLGTTIASLGDPTRPGLWLLQIWQPSPSGYGCGWCGGFAGRVF